MRGHQVPETVITKADNASVPPALPDFWTHFRSKTLQIPQVDVPEGRETTADNHVRPSAFGPGPFLFLTTSLQRRLRSSSRHFAVPVERFPTADALYLVRDTEIGRHVDISRSIYNVGGEKKESDDSAAPH